MDDGPVAFASTKDFDRTANAVRAFERLFDAAKPGEFTESLNTKQYWKCTGAISAGLYPGVLCWRKYVAGVWTWEDHATITGKLLGLNNELLVSGVRYEGRAIGATPAGDPLIHVQVGYGAVNCFEVIDISTIVLSCNESGLPVLDFETKWLKGSFTIHDTEPGDCP